LRSSAGVHAGACHTPPIRSFLASDAAAFITGERITVNGGHTID
jgi:NAD(P)-dependent dehydrogenase (short-subunit alcohol dehydrogenase family)